MLDHHGVLCDSSVVDLDSAFQVNLDPDPGFWWPKIEEEKNTAKIFYIFFWSKIVINLYSISTDEIY